MSANANGDGDDEVPGREIAYRLFAAEYDDASLSYAESDEERAPNYVITPTGARLNRVFAVGTLTEVTSVNDEMVRARIVDPTGAFVVYAGQYQPDELAFLEGIEPPAFVAVTGKARTFQPDDSDQVYTSLRPESIATVDAETRDRWVVSAAEQTIERIGTYAGAAELDVDGEALTDALLEADVDAGLAAGIPLAQDHYGTTPSYLAALRTCALEAVEVVAGERDQVSGLTVAPDATSAQYDASVASLADLDGVDTDALEPSADAEPEAQPAEPVAATADGSGAATAPEDAHSGSAAGTATSDGPDTAAVDAEPEAGTAGADRDAEPDAADEDTTATDTSETETGASAAESEPAGTDADADADTDAGTLETEGDETADLDAGESDDDLGDFDGGDVDDGMYEMDEEERERLEEEFGAEFTTGGEVEEPGEADIDVPDPEDVDADELEDESASSADESVAGDGAADADAAEPDDDLGAPPESGLETEGDDEPDDVSEAEADAEAEPEADTEAEPEADAEAEPEPDEPAADDESETAGSEGDDEPAEDVDLEEYVVETMEELDDGDGADRTELIETVTDDTGASAEEVEDAIQDALMGGQCYEPDDETLKAI